MNQESLNEHYKSIAKNYEDMFANSHEDGYTFMGKEGARELMKMMQLKVDDKLVDLGAGTCKTAGRKFQFTSPRPNKAGLLDVA